MSSLLAEIVPLALAASISPVLFLLQIATLTGERRIVRGAAVALGATLPLVVVAALVVTAGGAFDLPESAAAKGGLDIALGCVLIALGLAAALRPPKPEDPGEVREPAGPRRSFVLGLAAMGTNVTTFAFFIPAVKQIAAAEVSSAERLLASAVALAVTLLPAIVPLALAAVAPGASGRILSAIGRFMHDHRRGMQIVLCLGFGAWLVLKGIGEL